MDGQTDQTAHALRVGNAKVVVKPAMLVLLCAVFIGAIAVPVLRRDPASNAPAYGYANPQMWKFEAHQGAQAVAFASLGNEIKKSDVPTTIVDANSGFTVNVTHIGTSADSVYLRNAMNLDMKPDKKPLHLSFDARSIDKGAAPFPLTFTVRDSQTLLWSQRITVGSNWKHYEEKISFTKGSLLNVILAVHLGEKTGAVQVRNLQVVDAR